MKVSINGQERYLVFKHHVPLTVTWRGEPTPTEGTLARIEARGGEVFGEALAAKHPLDQYCKETGRKVAMQYLLRDLPREMRQQVWLGYHAARGKVGV
mgnify:CR=1 FL=1